MVHLKVNFDQFFSFAICWLQHFKSAESLSLIFEAWTIWACFGCLSYHLYKLGWFNSRRDKLESMIETKRSWWVQISFTSFSVFGLQSRMANWRSTWFASGSPVTSCPRPNWRQFDGKNWTLKYLIHFMLESNHIHDIELKVIQIIGDTFVGERVMLNKV